MSKQEHKRWKQTLKSRSRKKRKPPSQPRLSEEEKDEAFFRKYDFKPELPSRH